MRVQVLTDSTRLNSRPFFRQRKPGPLQFKYTSLLAVAHLTQGIVALLRKVELRGGGGLGEAPSAAAVDWASEKTTKSPLTSWRTVLCWFCVVVCTDEYKTRV